MVVRQAKVLCLKADYRITQTVACWVPEFQQECLNVSHCNLSTVNHFVLLEQLPRLHLVEFPPSILVFVLVFICICMVVGEFLATFLAMEHLETA